MMLKRADERSVAYKRDAGRRRRGASDRRWGQDLSADQEEEECSVATRMANGTQDAHNCRVAVARER